VLLNLTRPYRKVTIAFIARELALDVSEVESLLVDMILGTMPPYSVRTCPGSMCERIICTFNDTADAS
jgi:hypothetical protein